MKLVLFLLFIIPSLVSAQFKPIHAFSDDIHLNDSVNETKELTYLKSHKQKEVKSKPKNKFVAIGLALALGPFGVHRLYLGTESTVPLAYTLTLGGGFFILPLIDTFYILLNDKEYLENNPYFFIWNKKKKEASLIQ